MLYAMRHLVLLLAALGVLLCLASSIGVWYVELRVDRARLRVFERVDQAFSNIDNRLVATQNLAAKTKITAVDIQQGMQDWTKKEARERVAARFDIELKVQQLVKGLQQADRMLELSEDTIKQFGQALEIGRELGLSSDGELVTPLLERLANLKQDLNRAMDAADGLGQRIGEVRDDESLVDRTAQVATITARLIATFGKSTPV